jgi:hypothetical protein
MRSYVFRRATRCTAQIVLEDRGTQRLIHLAGVSGQVRHARVVRIVEPLSCPEITTSQSKRRHLCGEPTWKRYRK